MYICLPAYKGKRAGEMYLIDYVTPSNWGVLLCLDVDMWTDISLSIFIEQINNYVFIVCGKS